MSSRARARGGSAHDYEWKLQTKHLPPRVTVRTGAELRQYHLALDPATRQAARDHAGNFLYVPAPGVGTTL